MTQDGETEILARLERIEDALRDLARTRTRSSGLATREAICSACGGSGLEVGPGEQVGACVACGGARLVEEAAR